MVPVACTVWTSKPSVLCLPRQELEAFMGNTGIKCLLFLNSNSFHSISIPLPPHWDAEFVTFTWVPWRIRSPRALDNSAFNWGWWSTTEEGITSHTPLNAADKSPSRYFPCSFPWILGPSSPQALQGGLRLVNTCLLQPRFSHTPQILLTFNVQSNSASPVPAFLNPSQCITKILQVNKTHLL